jgi:hypothetical protein
VIFRQIDIVTRDLNLRVISRRPWVNWAGGQKMDDQSLTENLVEYFEGDKFVGGPFATPKESPILTAGKTGGARMILGSFVMSKVVVELFRVSG